MTHAEKAAFADLLKERDELRAALRMVFGHQLTADQRVYVQALLSKSEEQDVPGAERESEDGVEA